MNGRECVNGLECLGACDVEATPVEIITVTPPQNLQLLFKSNWYNLESSFTIFIILSSEI